MEATADTLLNQVANLFLSKIDKQNIDPKFLKKFTEQLLGKFSYTSSEPIKQKPASPNDGTGGSLVKDLKKVYNDLVKETTYKENYKKFLRYVLPDELLKQSTDNITTPAEKPEIKTVDKTIEKPEIKTVMSDEIKSDMSDAMSEIKTIEKPDTQSAEKPEIKTVEKPEIKSAPQMNEGRVDLIKDAPTEQKVIFDGFSERGWAFFSERLPKILKGIIPASKPESPKEGSGLGLLGGGIALLLGGLAALVTGLMTDGPFKGLLKILSVAGLTGGLKLLEKGAKTFINTLKNFIDAPIRLLDTVGTGLKGALSSLLPKGIGNIVKGTAGIFAKMLGGLVKFLKPILGKLPLIGTVISFGFAYTRFKSGDVVGGIIDVLSGLVGLLSLTGVGAAVAIPIQIGLDVLNAFLDAKAGGANEKTTQKKTGLLKEWALGLGKKLYETVKYIPIIGPFMQAVEDMQAGKWLEASYNLVRAIPGLGILVDVLNWFTGGETEQGIKEGLSNTGDMIGDWLGWLKDNIWEKITGFVTGVFDTVKDWWNNLSWDPRSWAGISPDTPTKSSIPKPAKTTVNVNGKEMSLDEWESQQTQPKTKLADGGIVTQPTEALVGEAGPEAVLPLDKYFDPQNLSLNNTTLEQIAGNTKDTNSSLKVLSDALFKLVTVLDKKMNQTGTTVINTPGQSSQQSTPASVIANVNADPIRRVRMQFA